MSPACAPAKCRTEVFFTGDLHRTDTCLPVVVMGWNPWRRYHLCDSPNRTSTECIMSGCL